jgi:cytochrome P450
MELSMAGRKYPPGPKSALAVSYALSRDPLAFLKDISQRYGDIVHLKLGSRHDFLLNHPDYIKMVLTAREEDLHRSFSRPLKPLLGNGLITSQGEYHRRQRRLLQPSFHHDQIAATAQVITDSAQHYRSTWRDGQKLEVMDEMMRITLDVIVKALFSMDVRGQAAEIGQLFKTVIARTSKRSIPYIEQFFAKLPLPSLKRYQRALARLDEIMYALIARRRADLQGHNDFLTSLIMLQDTEGDRAGLTDTEVRDEAMTVFFAGHETTSSALTWTWYLLSQHPEIERRMHEEVDNALAGRMPTAADFPRLSYTNMVLAESMRLYPPGWLLVRRPMVDFPLGEYVAPKGSYIHFSQYLMHRDARFFPEPEKFDPERWNPEAAAARPKYCYFPFGGGSRKCIGDGLAWMEGTFVLAVVAQKWKFRLVPGQRVVPAPMITLRPKYGMAMTVHAR